MATRIFIVGGCVCTTLSVYLVIHLINLSHVVQHCFMFAIFGRALLQCVVVATTSATFWTLCSLPQRVLNDTPILDGYFLSLLVVYVPSPQQVVRVLQSFGYLLIPPRYSLS